VQARSGNQSEQPNGGVSYQVLQHPKAVQLYQVQRKQQNGYAGTGPYGPGGEWRQLLTIDPAVPVSEKPCRSADWRIYSVKRLG
jgi:hypothetical protein